MNTFNSFLRSLAFTMPSEVALRSQFPFSVPAFAQLQTLAFHPNVTFFVGENGSGKSTLLEAIAQLAGLPAAGGSNNFKKAVQSDSDPFLSCLKLARGASRPKTAFFLRAESFFNVASQIDEFGVTASYGGASLHHQSHGESFLSLATHRFGPKGLYILDEPEAALSPQRQLSFLALMHQWQQQQSQVVIATHSPILLAYPHSQILHFSADGIEPIDYQQTEHYALTLDFLQHRERYLARLLTDHNE